MKNRIISGIIGLTVGDALGVPVEFDSRRQLKRNPVVDMREYGTHNQPKGTWSDDSQMVFCTMESLIEGYNLYNMAEKFKQWIYNSYWTPYGKIFDVGNTTRAAIRNMSLDIEPTECGGRNLRDNGNGSLMRILPMAYYLLNKEFSDEKERYKDVYDVSSLTHGHPISKIACAIYVEMAMELLRGNSIEQSYKQMCEVITNHYKLLNKEFLEPFSRILDGSLPNLSEDEIKSSGYVVDTLEAAIWCMFTKTSYKETVLTAINLGEDTDTVGAVTGGLAGIYYGIESIPDEWINSLARKEDILDLCERFKCYLKEGTRSGEVQ